MFALLNFGRKACAPTILETIFVIGWLILLQSDLEIVAQEMSDRFRELPCFVRQHSQPWLETNPLPVATEKEIATFKKNKPVYRVLLQKDSQPRYNILSLTKLAIAYAQLQNFY